MVFKIGLVAAHSTGKTTLAYLVAGVLKKRGLRVRVLPEVATEARETGKRINEQTTLLDQAWILLKQALYEVDAALAGYDVVICDRTVHDNYCYLASGAGENAFYKSFALGHAREHPYDALYYVPIVAPPVVDGLRSVSAEFQRKIDGQLRAYLAGNAVAFVTLDVPSADDTERDAWVHRIVSDTLMALQRKG